MKDVGRVERSFTGWVIGLRRWSLKAYDEKMAEERAAEEEAEVEES